MPGPLSQHPASWFANMLSYPEEMEYVADIRIIAMLFYSWTFMDVDTEDLKKFSTWFGDHVTCPIMSEAIYTPMSLLEIVAYAEINEKPPDRIRDMELSYRGHVLQRAHEICDQLYSEGRARFNMTTNRTEYQIPRRGFVGRLSNGDTSSESD